MTRAPHEGALVICQVRIDSDANASPNALRRTGTQDRRAAGEKKSGGRGGKHFAWSTQTRAALWLAGSIGWQASNAARKCACACGVLSVCREGLDVSTRRNLPPSHHSANRACTHVLPEPNATTYRMLPVGHRRCHCSLLAPCL
jgi:hypothetical protein